MLIFVRVGRFPNRCRASVLHFLPMKTPFTPTMATKVILIQKPLCRMTSGLETASAIPVPTAPRKATLMSPCSIFKNRSLNCCLRPSTQKRPIKSFSKTKPMAKRMTEMCRSLNTRLMIRGCGRFHRLHKERDPKTDRFAARPLCRNLGHFGRSSGGRNWKTVGRRSCVFFL